MRFVLVTLALIGALLGVDLSAAGIGTAVSITPHAHGWLFYLAASGGAGVVGAVLSGNVLTLADWAKRLDPDGKVPTIVELLSQTNEMLLDMRWIEGNLPTGHRTTVRTGLPAVAWRLLNQGVLPSKSTTAQIDEQCGMLEAWSEVDKDLALLNGNVDAFRASEAFAFLEAMNQEFSQTLIYGNAGIAPEEFTGIAVRFSTISGAQNASNVIDAGGTGSDNSSIYLVVWGEQTVMGIFPKGSKAGLIHEDYGEQTVETTTGIGGGRMRAFQERFQWKGGLALRDWRYVVRIANIDISDLIANGGAQALLINLMSKAIHRIPALGMGTPVFYTNRTVAEMLDIQERTAVGAGGGITYENVDGRRVANFRGIPIRTVDQLLETEARVV